MASTALSRLSSVSNLETVWKAYWPRIKHSSAGVDGITPKQFDDNKKQFIRLIHSEIAEGYAFRKLRGVSVPKSDPTKFRIICVPTVQDRIVQRSLLRAMETRAIQLGVDNEVSFGFVKDRDDNRRGTMAARTAAIRHRQAKPWAFKADISAFFDTIQRAQLIERLKSSFKLRSLTPLITSAISCEVDASNPRIRRILDDNGIISGRGLRQGMPLSPMLSNFLLRDFDRAFTAAGFDLVRYADDLIVLASSRDECDRIEALTRQELDKLGLKVSESKTEICAPEKSVEFLGLELELKPGTNQYGLYISKKKVEKIREQFTNFHDVDFAMREGLDLPKLLRRLENMRSGYVAAYNLADNFSIFEGQLQQWADNCITRIYSSMFTPAAISRLSPTQRRFLLLPQVTP